MRTGQGYYKSGTTDFSNIPISLAQLHLGQQLWMSASSAKSQTGSMSLCISAQIWLNIVGCSGQSWLVCTANWGINDGKCERYETMLMTFAQ